MVCASVPAHLHSRAHGTRIAYRSGTPRTKDLEHEQAREHRHHHRKTIRENAESLADQAKRLEAQLRLARGTKDNVTKAIAMKGSEGSLFIGDETDTATLIATVERAITGRARTLRELIETTGARRNRISGALVKLQVAKPNTVRNLGDESRAIWYIPGPRR